MLDFEYAARSHRGNVRKRNEDSCYTPEETGPQQIVIVADGMGGYNAGDVASALCVQVACNIFTAARAQELSEPVEDTMHRAYEGANTAILEYASSNEFYQGMGTTMVMLAVEGTEWVVGNVGDSRCYLVRGDAVRQVTRDHSLVQMMVERGRMTAEEAKNHPYRNVITRAIGGDTFAGVDIFREDIAPGDVMILCSDGLSNYLQEGDILNALTSPDLGAAADRLVRLALERGGSDNITVALARAGGQTDGR